MWYWAFKISFTCSGSISSSRRLNNNNEISYTISQCDLWTQFLSKLTRQKLTDENLVSSIGWRSVSGSYSDYSISSGGVGGGGGNDEYYGCYNTTQSTLIYELIYTTYTTTTSSSGSSSGSVGMSVDVSVGVSVGLVY